MRIRYCCPRPVLAPGSSFAIESDPPLAELTFRSGDAASLGRALRSLEELAARTSMERRALCAAATDLLRNSFSNGEVVARFPAALSAAQIEDIYRQHARWFEIFDRRRLTFSGDRTGGGWSLCAEDLDGQLAPWSGTIRADVDWELLPSIVSSHAGSLVQQVQRERAHPGVTFDDDSLAGLPEATEGSMQIKAQFVGCFHDDTRKAVAGWPSAPPEATGDQPLRRAEDAARFDGDRARALARFVAGAARQHRPSERYSTSSYLLTIEWHYTRADGQRLRGKRLLGSDGSGASLPPWSRSLDAALPAGYPLPQALSELLSPEAPGRRKG